MTDDPYWDAFINRAPSDPNNMITHAFASAPPGGVNPVRTEIHSPNVTAGHVKELGRFFGARSVGIVQLARDPFGDSDGGGPFFAIVSTMESEHDTRAAHGIGGQAPALRGLFVSFNLSAYIKELGYRADRSADDSERLATIAGLGAQSARIHVNDVVYTDLPLAADRRE